jgi:GntR family transcriptional regulator
MARPTHGRQPAYLEIAHKIRRDITSGALPAGTRLNEQQLMDDSHVSRGTVRQAIGELVSLGVVASQNGKGHFVRAPVRLTWRASDPEQNDGAAIPSDAWSRSVRTQGHEPSERISCEVAYADERIAEFLDVPTGEPVSIRRRLRYVDGDPFAIADSWYPRSIVAGSAIELPADISPGIYEVFARLGRPWVRTVDTWVARAPSYEEAALLIIPRGIPVAEVVRRSFDKDDVPVRLTLFTLPGDRHEIQYEHEEARTT